MNDVRNAAKDVSVLVIGCGFGGITAAMMLRREHVTNFRIIERSQGVGGTWYNNRYPGAEVDVPSSCYSWEHRPFLWSRTHAQQPEIEKYVEHVLTEEKLWDHLTLGVSVTELKWQADLSQWHVSLSNGEVFNVDFVISAVGLLSTPRYPDWPGYETFKGAKVHTAAYDTNVELKDKRVAVVGVGASAAQVIPTIAPIAKHVYVYQREPSWVLPKGDYDYSPQDIARMRNEPYAEYLKRRRRDFWATNRGMIFGRNYRPHTKASQKMKAFALNYIAETFKDRPDLREAVTPKYSYAGKRVVATSGYYPALLRDNVTLIAKGVDRLTETGIVDASGTETPVDVIIMATGYEPGNSLKNLQIVGREGKTLAETWGDEPRAFFGVTVPSFPNLFIMYGPSTHGGMIFSNHQSQARWAAHAIRQWRKGRRTYEVKPTALKWYVKWLDAVMARTAWQEADSYFKNAQGKIITQWPWDAYAYMIMTRLFGGRLSHKIS